MLNDSTFGSANKLNSFIEIDSIIITNHARERLKERWNSSGDIDPILYRALREGIVETKNGTVLKHRNGNKPPCIEVYVSSESNLGLTRFILRQSGDDYILVTLYPTQESHVPFCILTLIDPE
jgi:hypothetical protein